MTSDHIQIPKPPQLPPVAEEDQEMTFFQHLGELHGVALGVVPLGARA